MTACNTLARKRGGAGNLQKVAKNSVRCALKIVRRDLPGHIERDVAFQSQHHLLKRTVEAVNDVQMQALFQQEGKPEHIFLGKIQISCHILHRHIAVEEYRLSRFGKDGRLEKVQFSLFHLLQAVIGSGSLEEKRHVGNT